MTTALAHRPTDNSGHFMWVERRNRFFPLVRDWLDNHRQLTRRIAHTRNATPRTTEESNA